MKVHALLAFNNIQHKTQHTFGVMYIYTFFGLAKCSWLHCISLASYQIL